MSSSEQAITTRTDIQKYLEDIGITEPIRKRIDEVYSYIQRINPSTFTDIFVTEYIKEDGTRVYSDVDFFTETGIIVTMEGFLINNAIVVANIKKHFVVLELNAKDYDFKKANEKSRLKISTWYDSPEVTGELRATGRNCDYAMEIYRKYLLPNIRR